MNEGKGWRREEAKKLHSRQSKQIKSNHFRFQQHHHRHHSFHRLCFSLTHTVCVATLFSVTVKDTETHVWALLYSTTTAEVTFRLRQQIDSLERVTGRSWNGLFELDWPTAAAGGSGLLHRFPGVVIYQAKTDFCRPPTGCWTVRFQLAHLPTLHFEQFGADDHFFSLRE